MKKINFLVLLLFSFVFAENMLGNIKLGESMSAVLERYPRLGESKFQNIVQTALPYPLHVLDREPRKLMQSEYMDIQCYFDDNKKVEAITVFLQDAQSQDLLLHETGKGLRVGDTPVEMQLIYGHPLEISEYYYNDIDGERVRRRIYYYDDLCVQTRTYEDLPEFVDLLVVGKYDLSKVKEKKDTPIRSRS